MKKTISILISFALIIPSLLSGGIKAKAASPPASYNCDPSALSYITSVKDQGEYGNCWAFAAIACCEAEAVKNHEANVNSIDLSEYHLAYFSYNGERSTGDSVISEQPYYEFGGFTTLPIFTLSSRIGLVDESVADYDDFTADPTVGLDAALMYADNEYCLSNAYTYSLPDEIDGVKKAIMTYGAVQTSYYSSETFLNKGYSSNKIYAQYCPESYASDHAVTIVGWDDDYSKNNFKSSYRPQNNGAWLVKNSWGDDWGLSGYFWLSYEDKSAVEATAFDVTPADDDYDNSYQHDGGIANAYMQSDLTMANMFTAQSNEKLSAIGVAVSNASNSDYTIKIYVNPETSKSVSANQAKIVHEQSGIIERSGFVTIPLTSDVILSEADSFLIVVETSSSVLVDIDQTIPLEEPIFASSSSSVLPSQSFVISYGEFIDATDSSQVAQPFNARIKAFTYNLDRGEARLQSPPEASNVKYGQTLEASVLSGGSVIDSLTSARINGEWSFNDPSELVENGDTVKVTFTPLSSEYESIECEITVGATADRPTITLTTDKSTYRDGETVRVTATVENAYSSDISDLPSVRLFYQINDGERIYFTDSFNFPTDYDHVKLTIGAESEAVEGKYLSAQKIRTFTVKAPEDTSGSQQSNGGLNNDSDSSSLGGSSGAAVNQSGNGAESSSSATSSQSSSSETAETFRYIENPPKDEEHSSAMMGCFSSVSVSALSIVCAVFGAALLKKKKD